MPASTLLLIIDAQFDFCNPGGALFVPGAEKDIVRIAKLIREKSSAIDDVIVTLDTHQILDISHPGFWIDAEGQNPLPLTPINFSEVKSGKWIPIWEKEWVSLYLERLESQNQFTHLIWPEHCVLGTAGHALEPVLASALHNRARLSGRNHLTVIKGLNPFTEHFGIFEAQVPMGGDPDTQLNEQLLSQLGEYDNILVCGEARSHCVATSIGQMIQYAPELIPRTTLLTDCMSDVQGMGHLADPIYKEAASKGIRFGLSTEI